MTRKHDIAFIESNDNIDHKNEDEVKCFSE